MNRASRLKVLELSNFKCFRSQPIEFGDLTILTGLNGMGKSSVIQALLLLRQSFSDHRSRNLKLNGEYVELGNASDVFLDIAEEDEVSLAIEYQKEIQDLRYRTEYRFSYDRSTESLRQMPTKGRFGIRSRPVAKVWDPLIRDWRETTDEDRQSFGLPRFPNIFSLSGFQYLSAERLGPRKMLYDFQEERRRHSLGKSGEFVFSFLESVGDLTLAEDDPRLSANADQLTIASQTVGWLQETSPGTRLELKPLKEVDAHSARFTYDRKGDVPSRPFRPVNVGFGISYVLPVLAALIAAEEGDLIIIENPEAHIHPRGQTKLGQLAARASSAGVQIIIETHSDHFLDGVRIEARQSRLNPDRTAIHYFTRFGSEAAVVSPTLSEDGRLSEWPEGFFDERDDNMINLMRPIES